MSDVNRTSDERCHFTHLFYGRCKLTKGHEGDHKVERGVGEPETAEHRGQLQSPDRRDAAALLVQRQIDDAALTSNENLTAALAWLRGPWQASDNRQHAANVLAEIERLTRDMTALQSQWDDMQQGFVEVFGEPVQDAIELLGTVERIRSSNETVEQLPQGALEFAQRLGSLFDMKMPLGDRERKAAFMVVQWGKERYSQKANSCHHLPTQAEWCPRCNPPAQSEGDRRG